MRYTLMLTALAATATCFGLALAPAAAQNPQAPDLKFMVEADDVNLAEIKLGKLAEKRAGCEAVKKFAAKMISDHTKLNEQLCELAKKEGLTLPHQLDAGHKESYEQLAKLNDAEFDRLYTKDMVAGHEKTLMKFEQEATSGQDPAVRAIAKTALPILREHLRLAKETVQAVKTQR